MSLKPFNSVGGVSVGEVPVTIIDASGNISNVSSLTATSIAGNITTASQTNITNVGTLLGLSVTGNTTTTGIKTDNYYYANGLPVDFQQTGGSNTQVQFNDNGDFGGSSAFTFNKATNQLTLSGNASVGNLSATGISGTLSTAAQPNITSVGTLSSLAVAGNITSANASLGNTASANYFVGDGSKLTNLSTVYGYEIHVSQLSGNDTTGDGTLLYPVATITKALTLLSGNSRNIIVHPGVYNESPTVTNTYAVLQTLSSAGNNVEITGTLTLAVPCTVDGFLLNTVAITSSTGSGSVYLWNNTVKTSVTKSGSQAYTEINNCEMQSSSGVSITGAGTVNIDSNKNYFVTVNNASAIVTIKNCTQVLAPSVVAGALYINDCGVFSATATSNAITSSAGSIASITNCQVVTATGAPARVSLAGFYGLDDVQYDKANSTLTGTSLATKTYFQALNTDTANVSFTLNVTGNASVGNLSATKISGTLTTASQTNITTVGTLGNLDVTSNVSAGNVKTNNLLYANGSPWDLGGNPGGANTSIQYNNNGEFDGSASFTFDQTTNTVSILNDLSVGNSITLTNSEGTIQATGNINLVTATDSNIVITSAYDYSGGSWVFDNTGNLRGPNDCLTLDTGYDTGNAGLAGRYSYLAMTNTYDSGNIGSQILMPRPESLGFPSIQLTVRDDNKTSPSTTWSFDNDGNLTAPGNITTSANVSAGNIIATSLANLHAINISQSITWDAEGSQIYEDGGLVLESLAGGDGISISANSSVYVTAGAGNSNSQWTFETDGNLTLPQGGVISEDYSSIGSSTVTITPNGGNPTQQLQIYPTAADGDHIHLTSGNLQATDIYLGSDSQYIRTSNVGGMVIGTDGGEFGINVWNFGTDGTTTFPTLTVQRGDNPSGTITGQTLLFGDANQEAIISTPDGTPGNEYSQRLVINPGEGYNYGEGGDIYLWAGRGGDGSGSGGDIKIRGGQGGANTQGGDGGDGGYIRMEAGDAASTGGSPGYIYIKGGQNSTGQGGQVTVIGGQGATVGGDANIYGGYGQTTGGNVNIWGGASGNGQANEGHVNIQTGGNTWTFSADGTLALSDNGLLWNNGGLTTLQAGTDGAQIGSNDGQSYVIANANGTYMQTLADTSNYLWHFSTDGTLTTPGNIVIDNSGDAFVESTANVNITASASNWIFGTDSSLSVPGVIKSGNAGAGFSNGITSITLGVDTEVILDASIFGGPVVGQVVISGVVGTTEANGTWYYEASSPNSIQLFNGPGATNPVDSLGWTAYVSGGLAVSTDYSAGTVTIESGIYQWTFGGSTFTAPGLITTSTDISAQGNVAASGVKTDNYMYANGAPVDFQQAGGSNTQVQFNNNNDFGGSSNFTFNTATNVLNVTGNVDSTNLNSTNVIATANITATQNIVTDSILGRTDGVTISATGANSNVTLVATGIGTVNVSNFRITNLATPNAQSDAVTKQYVDTAISSGISYHEPVQVATTTTLAIATSGTTVYVQPNGAANGIGAYISTTGTYTNIDGIPINSIGTRILVKNESNAAWNGVYTYANATHIVRSTDTDQYGSNSTEELSINDYFFTQTGDINEGSAFIVNSPAGVITFGTSNITFSTFSTSQVYNAGTGLTLNNTTFSITNTAVTTGSYGSGDSASTFTVNQQGQLTAAGSTPITANAANLSGTVLSTGVVTSSLTSVGTLGTLAVTGVVTVGTTSINSAILTTSSTVTTTLANIDVTSGVNGVEFFIKSVDSSGNKYTIAKLQAVTNGTDVDWVQYGGTSLGGQTGSLSCTITTSGPNKYLNLRVTPSSSNSTSWTTQFSTI